MIKIITTFLILALPFTVSAKAVNNGESYPEFLNYLLDLNADMSIGEQKGEKESLRNRFLRSKGMSYGLQGGKYWAAKKISEYLNSKDTLLSSTYDARAIIVEYKGFLILPPVIDELDGKTVYKSDGSQIRTAEQIYQIRSNPRFVSKVPIWQDYIKFDEQNPSIKYVNVLPSTKKPDEIKVWRAAVLEGWLQGIEQAKRGSTSKIAMITSDYQGLIRYHILRDRNMIQDLDVSEQFNEVVGGGSSMTINDVIINIRTNPMLQNNRFEWQAVPQLPEVKTIFPKGVVVSESELGG
jgi:defect-in-organelle-trafficking protein DotC